MTGGAARGGGRSSQSWCSLPTLGQQASWPRRTGCSPARGAGRRAEAPRRTVRPPRRPAAATTASVAAQERRLSRGGPARRLARGPAHRSSAGAPAWQPAPRDEAAAKLPRKSAREHSAAIWPANWSGRRLSGRGRAEGALPPHSTLRLGAGGPPTHPAVDGG